MDGQHPEEQDMIWDSVLESMQAHGILEKFHKTDSLQVQTMMKECGTQVARDLSYIFKLTKEQQFQKRESFMNSCDEQRLICIMNLVSLSIRTWLESGQGKYTRFGTTFPIAHA